MPILIDFNGTIIASLFTQIRPGTIIAEDLVRHCIFNTIRSYKTKFEDKYGRLIFCNDGRNYWRKEIYQQYKSGRKKDRDASGVDWNSIFKFINNIRSEVEENFPYQTLTVDRAEADDIIAIIVKHFHKSGKFLIVSSDKDLGQLKKYSSVDLYSPRLKKFVKIDDPFVLLNTHILIGDSTDSIPNFLSPDNTFVDNLRQKTITKKNLDLWSKLNPEDFCTPSMEVGYHRNKILIDLDHIPTSIEQDILDAYHKPYLTSNSKIFNYFVKNKLTNLMDGINQFKVQNNIPKPILGTVSDTLNPTDRKGTLDEWLQ